MFKIRYIIVIVLCFFIERVDATSFPSVGYLSIDQGLSNNSIRCIFKDHSGFLWFGTYDGLNRYDGYGFKVYRNRYSDKTSLVNNYIFCIGEDRDYHLWVGTRGGVGVYNPITGEFSSVNYKTSSGGQLQKVTVGVRALKPDNTGNVLLGTLGQGLMLYSKTLGYAIQIPLIESHQQSYDYDVQAIKITGNNEIWVFIPQKGLCIFDVVSKCLKVVNDQVKSAYCMEMDGKNIWIGTAEGVYCYDQTTRQMSKVLDQSNGKLSNSKVAAMLVEKDKLWIGLNGGGIKFYDKRTKEVTSLQTADGRSPLSSEAVYTIFEDNESRKWIGTLTGGVNIIDPQKQRFKTVTHDPSDPASLPSNFIYAIYEPNHQDLWLGTDGGGLIVWNRTNDRFKTYKHDVNNPRSLSDNMVTSITSDHSGEIWLGTFFNGVNRYNKNNDSFDQYRCINPINHIENKTVSTMCTDTAGVVWVGTLKGGGINGGLYKFNKKANRFDAFDLSQSDWFTIMEDKTGQLWGGSVTNLIKVDKINRRHQIINMDNYVVLMYEDQRHNFWIGTEGGGLILFDRKKFKIIKRYTTENGLCNNSVLNILEDGKHNLWLSTYNGISRFNPDEETFKNYYQSDGLQSNQFHYNSSCKLFDGELVFGGNKGLNIFEPEQVKEINTVPKLIISNLSINNMSPAESASYIDETNSGAITNIKVPYNKAEFSFEFTALEFTAPDKIKYAYKMDSWDRSWTYTDHIRLANYTHLDEGKYIFRVRCTNAEGKWMPNEVVLNIIVLPPWYLSWWAYLSYLVVVVSGVYWYLSYRARETRLRYEIKLARVNADNQKVLQEKERELNEKRLEFFTGISHEFRTPLSLIINPVKDLLNRSSGNDHHDLNIVYRNARRLLSLVDQVLLFRKADSGVSRLNVGPLNIVQVCQDVYLCFVQQAKLAGITFELDAPPTPVMIYGDREKIEIILFNLISNAIKYTEGGKKVVVTVEERENDVEIKVIDSGHGIPSNIGDRLFDKFYRSRETTRAIKAGFGIGLYLAKQFALDHQGELTYNSHTGKGTTFILTLKKGVAHYPDDVISMLESEPSEFLSELVEDHTTNFTAPAQHQQEEFRAENIFTDKKSILIIDDDQEIRQYIKSVMKSQYVVYEAADGESGLRIAKEKIPSLVICDVMMPGMNGIELCAIIKHDPTLSYIPMILLTASSSPENKLKGLESGADDYISKPFEKDILVARVANLLQIRNDLQSYFYNAITLKSGNVNISQEYKQFLEKCIEVVEQHLTDPDFSIKILADQIGMSHSNLYRKVKSLSGHTVNGFIRYIRLRKAAELLIQSDMNVNEVAFETGFNNIKYFRTQFFKLFGTNPSDFLRQKRPVFKKRFNVID